MKISVHLLFLSFCFLLCSGCSDKEVASPVIGSWKLTTWTVGIPMDLKNHSVYSTNLLDQTTCHVNEVLSFDSNGTITSADTFNPEITISLKDGTSDDYIVKEMCADGSIGFTADYMAVDDDKVEFNNVMGILENEKLTVVYESAVKIYNEGLTEIIDLKDLTLVYEKIK
ncbi:hypothetical protein [Gelidibacter mesophilus]|uniref:hypothetical protein n=1 Tax=Gelidibacter mesophilus TaxID=169050 RepID=UPI0004871636|nr:hypothetical protein [Gelidibacter mesophilus]